MTIGAEGEWLGIDQLVNDANAAVLQVRGPVWVKTGLPPKIGG